MMQSKRGVAIGCALAALVTAFAAHPIARTEETPKTAVLDPSRPETWDAAIAQLRKQEDELVKTLIVVAEDKKRDNDTRQKAVLALSGLRNKRCLEFLIANVSLHLPGRDMVYADDQAKAQPCLYALVQRRQWGDGRTLGRGPDAGEWLPLEKRTDWGTAHAIIDDLELDARTPRDLIYLAHALELILGRDLAASAVDYTLKQRVPRADCPWRKNLTAILTYLKHR